MASENKQVLKNFASLGIVQFANYFLPLISIPIISRIIGPDKFGVINYAAAFVGYFNLLIGYGFDLTATRKISKDSKNVELRNQVFSEVFFCQVFLFLISVILFLVCLFSIPNLSSEIYVSVFSFLICIATLMTQNWLFQAMRDLSKVALLNFLSKFLFTILVIVFVRKKADYILQPLILGLIQVIISIASFTWAYKTYQLKLKIVHVKTLFSLLWTEKMIFFSMIVINLYTTTNTVMLGFLASQRQVGFYTAAQRLVSVITVIFITPLSQSLYPFIGKALAESTEKGLTIVRKFFPLLILIFGILGLGMYFLGPLILRGFYGKAFIPSIIAFQIMAFIPLILAVGNIWGMQIMLNLNMDRPFFFITAGGAVIGLVLNYLMIKQLGYVGTAWNYLIVEVYITTAMYIVLRIKGFNPIDFRLFNPIVFYRQVKPMILTVLKK
jgi:PST family polysaccharide transporter